MKNNGTFGLIDDLSIEYDGNHLLKVTDAAEALNYNGALDFNDGANADCEYHYDSNGALTYDSNRGITSITYDYGHHPYKISMQTKKRTHYNCYTSDGRKLSSKHEGMIPTGTGSYRRFSTTDLYIDGLILRDGVPYIWQFDGGYVSLNENGTPTSWNYYITDHLGSTRMVVDSNNNVKETINYYPFGSEMRMDAPSQMASDTWQQYRFTGKELDNQNGLNWYDFGARLFDVAGVPMWTSVDPLAEKYYPFTPYSYCAGDPVNKFDPDGRDGVRIIDTNNRTVTIKATYFVRTSPHMYRRDGVVMSLPGYLDSDIQKMNAYNNELNNKGYAISDGDYSGYKVQFDLTFVDGKDLSPEITIAEYEGFDISNTIEPGNEYTHKNVGFKETINSDGSTCVVGGVTDNNKKIVMNVGTDYTDTEMNRGHELFHTLGAQHPKGSGASSGIMAYPPQQPNQSDINNLMKNNVLKDVNK